MKQYCVISAPPDTYSGYGARARDFIKAVYELKKDEWDIQIIPQRWGNTSWGFLEDNKEEWGWMIPLLLKGPLTKQPDYWFQITIPNDKNMPDIISTFSPEENYLMLKIGSDTLREGRKVVTNLTSDEVYKKIENEIT